MSFLDQIRTKPEGTRRRYALFISGLITGIVFIFWLIVWRELEIPTNDPAVASDQKNPIQSLGEMFSGGFDRFKEQFGGPDTQYSGITKNIDGFFPTTTAATTSSSSISYSTTTVQQ